MEVTTFSSPLRNGEDVLVFDSPDTITSFSTFFLERDSKFGSFSGHFTRKGWMEKEFLFCIQEFQLLPRIYAAPYCTRFYQVLRMSFCEADQHLPTSLPLRVLQGVVSFACSQWVVLLNLSSRNLLLKISAHSSSYPNPVVFLVDSVCTISIPFLSF